MKFTNKMDYPKYAIEWLGFDEYDYIDGVISATTLLDPPKIHILKKRHKDELTIDYSDLIAQRYGTAIHASFELAPLTNILLREERLFTELLDYKISGKPDLVKQVYDTITFNGQNIDIQTSMPFTSGDYKAGKIIDLKSTSVWSFVYNDKDEKYVEQLSIYRYLLKENGYYIDDECEILMIFTDWSKKQARKDSNYPQSRIATKKLQLYSIEKTKSFLMDKIMALKKLEDAPESELPPCSRKDLWMKEDEYAVMRKGGSRAIKLCFTEQEANEYIVKNNLDPKSYYVELRKAKAKRCEYCIVRKFCDQYKLMKDIGMVDEVEDNV